MSIDLDQRSSREPPMVSFSAANTRAPVHIDCSPAQRARHAPVTSVAATQRRVVMLGCLALLGVLAIGIAARSLDVQPFADCLSAPVRVALGSETTTTVTMGAGAACAITPIVPDATIADLKIVAAPRHGTVTPRGRTGATYRPDPRYRGEDSFELALRGRSGGENGIAVVRVTVDVR